MREVGRGPLACQVAEISLLGLRRNWTRFQGSALSRPTHQGAGSTQGHQDTRATCLISISQANGFTANTDSLFSNRKTFFLKNKKMKTPLLFGELNLLCVSVRGDRSGSSAVETLGLFWRLWLAGLSARNLSPRISIEPPPPCLSEGNSQDHLLEAASLSTQGQSHQPPSCCRPPTRLPHSSDNAGPLRAGNVSAFGCTVTSPSDTIWSITGVQ